MFRELKPYATRVATGLPWAPTIPSHWSLLRNKYFLQERKDVVGGQSASLQLLALTKSGVITRDINNLEGKVPATFDTYQHVDEGDLIFCHFDIDETPRTVGLAPVPGMITSAYTRFKVGAGVSASFLANYYIALDDRKALRQLYTGLRKSIKTDAFLAARTPLPPPAEQAAIVKYLGHAHARIDRAIAAKRKLIALLEEQKQAIINQAVTRGLDPTVPMKDSGVPWIGRVPARWEMVPLKRIGRYKSGAGFPVSFQGKMEGDIPFAKVSDMNRAGNEEWIHAAESTVTRSEARELSAFVFPRNTIVFPKVGGALLTNKRRRLARPACVDNNVMGAILDETALNPDFSFLMMIVLDLGKLAKPGPVPAIGEGDVREIRVAVPPLPEQGMIVDHVQSATRAVDEARSRITSEVDLLREFRTRLTSDVVTGQLDVREIAALLPDFVEQAAVDADSGEDEPFDELDEVLEEAGA